MPHADVELGRPVDTTVLAEHQPPDFVEGGDKVDRGQVVVVGGDAETPGGAMLAAIGALRSGAGRAHVIVDATVVATMAVAHPELRVSPLLEDARAWTVRRT